MIKKNIYSGFLLYIIFSSLFSEKLSEVNIIINKAERKFRSIDDYQVNMTISIAIPAFRMPKKKYKVFFKQPDMIKVKSRGFGLLPKTGMFTSPQENFNNLTDMRINPNGEEVGKNKVLIVGNLIVDSLALKMPNDYARLTFKPTVNVTIDTAQWVITNVVTKIDTIKIMEIQNTYGYVDGEFYLPVKSTVEYFVKDARLTKCINKDIGSIMGSQKPVNVQSDMVKGSITVIYDKYQVNQGLKDSIFKK